LNITNKKYNCHQQAVWQNGGFGAFLEAKVLKQSSGIFSKLVLKNRHFAKLPDVSRNFTKRCPNQIIKK